MVKPYRYFVSIYLFFICIPPSFNPKRVPGNDRSRSFNSQGFYTDIASLMLPSSFDGSRFFLFLLHQHSGCWSIEWRRQLWETKKIIKKDSVGERKAFCLVHAYRKAWKNLDEKYSKQTIYSRAERQARQYQRFCSLQRMRILSRLEWSKNLFLKFFRYCVGIWHDSAKQIADYIYARNW